MNCRNCDYSFSRNRDTCPNCGCHNPGSTTERAFKIGAILLGLAALLLIVYVCKFH